jgi:hypothetical protein
LEIALASKITTGEGTNLKVTSDGITDLAGNAAVVIDAGPFKVDQTAPVITAGVPTGTKGDNGTWLSDVTVPFSATDNLSGFAPEGSKYTDMDPKTTSGVGTNLFVTSDGIYDLAGNFAAGIPAGPFSILPIVPDAGILASETKKLRVYYEILNPHRFVSIEPATPTTYYAYHPLTPTDSSAFDKIKLDAGAYQFIQQNINLNKPLFPYFGESDLSKKKGF